jgi:AraC family transcriptional regulator
MNTNTSAELFRAAALYIYDHLDDAVSVDVVAQALNVSTSTLKRVFAEIVEQSPGVFIRRVRMEFALRSLQDRKTSVLQVALAAGFEDHSAFTRSFRRAFGYAPSDARDKHNIVRELDSVELEDPELIAVQDLHVSGVTEAGHYFDCAPRAWNALQSKLNDIMKITDDDSLIFVGIPHDNPHASASTPRESQVRFTAAVVGLTSQQSNSLTAHSIESGQYAAFRFRGRINHIGLALHYVYGAWATRKQQAIGSGSPILLSERIPVSGLELDVRILVPLRKHP